MASPSATILDGDALLVVDVQNDFLPGGALPVPGGDAVIGPVNRLMPAFAHVVLTQDWHPPGHVSFASRHGRAPFESLSLAYGTQALWPDHCVRGTHGAALAATLDVARADLVIRKGHRVETDSYSAFLEADRVASTGLAGALRERGVTRVFLAGLATDFCVLWSALDARAAGFDVVLVADAVRGIDRDGSLARAFSAMDAAGVARIESRALAP